MIQILHGFAALSKNPATQNPHDVPRATTKNTTAHDNIKASPWLLSSIINHLSSSMIIINDLTVESSFLAIAAIRTAFVSENGTASRKDFRKRQCTYQSNPWTDFYFVNPFLIFVHKDGYTIRHSNDNAMLCSKAPNTAEFDMRILCVSFVAWVLVSFVVALRSQPHWQLQSWSARQRPGFNRELSVWPNREPIRPFHTLPSVSMPSPRSCKSDLHRTEEGSMKHHANHGAKPEKLCQTLGPTHTQTMSSGSCIKSDFRILNLVCCAAASHWSKKCSTKDHHTRITQALNLCSNFFISSYGVKMSIMPMK